MIPMEFDFVIKKEIILVRPDHILKRAESTMYSSYVTDSNGAEHPSTSCENDLTSNFYYLAYLPAIERQLQR